MAFFQPGDVYITSLLISGTKGSVECRSTLYNLSIYESIFTPGLLAEITLHEEHDIPNIVGMVGEERVTITFGTPKRQSATYEFILNTLKGSLSGDNLRNKIYVLNCASPHILNDKSQVIQKGFNTQYSSMVSEIHSSYLKAAKGLVTEPTNGVQMYNVQNLRPLAAIDAIRRRSTSASNLSGSYVYFENRDEFKFVTLETLFQGGTGDRVYTQQSAANYSENNLTFNSIISLNFEQQFDAAKKLSQGAVASEVRTFDVNLMKWSKRLVKINEGAFKRADSGNMTSGAFAGLFGSTPGRTITMPTDSNSPPTNLPETAPQQNALASLASQGNCLFNVPGDSELKVGDMCELRVYVRTAETGNPVLEPNVSGRYLISRLRHFIDHPKRKPRYVCSIDGIKASYNEGV